MVNIHLFLCIKGHERLHHLAFSEERTKMIWLTVFGLVNASFVPLQRRDVETQINTNGDAVCKLKYELHDYDPNPNPNSTVVASDGKFRAQVLTDFTFRFEYSESGVFENRPTLTIVNRNLRVPHFKTYEQDGKLLILTENFNISYVVGSGLKSGEDLRVVSLDPSKTFNGDSSFVWEYGMTSDNDPGNLFGTYRTLDQTDNPTMNCTENKKDHCVFGLVSRNGWAVIDDHDSPILDCNDWWSDDKTFYKHNSNIDLYLIAAERNYPLALMEYRKIAGSIPIHPRYAHGIWWTRWYNMLDIDVLEQVEQHIVHSLPLDVLILDMNWHTKNDWTGYTFDTNLYPDYASFLEEIQSLGLAIGANLHDASGINNWESLYTEAAQAINHANRTSAIPFDICNRTQTLTALEDIVLKDLEDKGMDFWWIDWQQGENNHGVPGGKFNPTIWTDKVRCTNPKRQSLALGRSNAQTKRGMVLARFGGLGNHRYQVGFSGDVKHLSWSDLAYQPYFSATASNVGYGFWSHDIEGPGAGHELYTRWIQWGALSGIMRHHDRGMSSGSCKDPFPTDDLDRCSIVQPWKVPPRFFDIIREALLFRSWLIPYIYTKTRVAYDTGVSLIRPLYYQWPNIDNAYEFKQQYMFGDKIMVRPIVEPGDSTTLVRNVSIWLPPGCWYEQGMNLIEVKDKSGEMLTRTYDLSEIPFFVMCGSAIPIRPGILEQASNFQELGNARKDYDTLGWRLYLAIDQDFTQGTVYQDDGETMAYVSNDFSYIDLKAQRKANVLSISAQQIGAYGVGKKQAHWIRIPNVAPNFKLSANAPKMTTLYDPFSLELILQLEAIDVQNTKPLFEFDIIFDLDITKQIKLLSPLPKQMWRARVSENFTTR